MTLVYTVAQQKGGAGKTTLAASLAAALAAGHRVALLDIDPQRSLSQWHRLRTARTPAAAAITLCEASGWRLAGELARLKHGHEFIIIDTSPQIDTDARIAIRAADLVLIPIQPSPPDFWAAQATLKLAAAERRPTCIILNRTSATSRLRSQIEAECAAQGLTIARATLGNRAGYANAFAMGLGATELAPKSTAAGEIHLLLEELRQGQGSAPCLNSGDPPKAGSLWKPIP